MTKPVSPAAKVAIVSASSAVAGTIITLVAVHAAFRVPKHLKRFVPVKSK